MKTTIAILIICIYLVGMISVSATVEMVGGIDVIAENAGFSGTLKPGITSITLGDTEFIRDINADEVQGFSALFANDDNTLGTVTARRASWWPWGGSTTTTVKDPAKSYALLKFKAPDTPINTLLIDSGLPSSISFDTFKNTILTAGETWNNNGVVKKRTTDFYGDVSLAPSGTKAQANDKKFVQSFQYFKDSWLAATYFSSKEFSSTASITDADTIYNTKYAYSTDPIKTTDANQRFVDLETVALHEMGHPIGLDDIYNKADKKWDISEVMNSYIWGEIKHGLGKGDQSGLVAKYS
jgi:hypothetical protein